MKRTHTLLARTNNRAETRVFCLIGRADGTGRGLGVVPTCEFCLVLRDLWLESARHPPTVRRFRAWLKLHPEAKALRGAACEQYELEAKARAEANGRIVKALKKVTP